MNFKGEAIRASEASIAVMAAELGVPYFRLRGVIEVEAPRGPFDREGRPAMLFEPFHFYRRIPTSKQGEALDAGVAMTRQPRRGEYPDDSYPKLARALEIDAKAALESCSWGRGQVMGFNFKDAGYPNVFAMVEAFKRSESEQLRGMVSFIKAKGLVGALKAGNEHAFAKGYNGKNYAMLGYHTKIAAAWAKWRERPEPPAARAVPEASAPPVTTAVTKEGAAVTAGGVIVAVQTANETGKIVKEASDTATGLLDAVLNPRVFVLVAVAAVFGAIWYWRNRRIATEGV